MAFWPKTEERSSPRLTETTMGTVRTTLSTTLAAGGTAVVAPMSTRTDATTARASPPTYTGGVLMLHGTTGLSSSRR